VAREKVTFTMVFIGSNRGKAVRTNNWRVVMLSDEGPLHNITPRHVVAFKTARSGSSSSVEDLK
jgi:hypothetical protein